MGMERDLVDDRRLPSRRFSEWGIGLRSVLPEAPAPSAPVRRTRVIVARLNCAPQGSLALRLSAFGRRGDPGSILI